MSVDQPQTFDAAAFAEWVAGSAQALPRAFCGVTQDSRRVTRDCLYVALRGERFDGHDFVAHALQAGAAAALVDTSWRAPAEAAAWPLLRVEDTRLALADAARAWRLERQALIVGVTGSSGKTTTKEMAAALFGGGGRVCATHGNFNNEIGLPLSLLTLAADAAFGVFELGSNHPGEIGRLADILRPQAGIIASIGSAHIEHFGSLDAIADEKGALLQALPTDGFAVLCREMAFFERLSELSQAPVVTTSLASREADFFGELVEPFSGTVRVTERAVGRQTLLRSGVPGEHNASNLLLAFAAARTAGISAEAATQALSGLTLPGMRWDVSVRSGVTIVNDAYNANPQSMREVLRTFMQLPCDGRRIAVLGDMLELGPHTEALHREIGRYVADLKLDGVIGVGPDTGRFLVGEAVKAGYPQHCVQCFPDAETAAAAVRQMVRTGDGVLLKASRSMRLERILDAWPI